MHLSFYLPAMENRNLELKKISGSTSGKEPACLRRRHKRHGFDPWFGKIPGGENGNSLQHSCWEKYHGQRSLSGYSPQGCKELDTTEVT